jgi:hypothetical protein
MAERKESVTAMRPESGRQPRTLPRENHAEEVGQWLTEFDWHHVADLTTDSETPFTAAALERAVEKFLERVESIAGGEVSWFRSIEDAEEGRGHAHLLLHGTRKLPIAVIRQCWSHGYARVAQYDPNRRGAEYTAKKIAKSDYAVSKTWPPLLRDVPKLGEDLGVILSRDVTRTSRGQIQSKVIASRDVVDLASWAESMVDIVFAKAGLSERGEAA